MLKELNSKSTCDPNIIKSSIPGTFANVCPSSTLILNAQETSLQYINSACGGFISPLYSQIIGGQAAFTPSGTANTYGWNLINSATYLGFLTIKSNTINCNDSPYSISANEFNGSVNTSTFSWSTPTGSIINTTSDTYTTFTSGVYSLTVTYKPNCTVSDVFSITINNNLLATVNTTNVSCFGYNDGKFFINVTPSLTLGSYSYSYSVGSYTLPTINSLGAGAYNYTVTNPFNPNECRLTNTITIFQPNQLIISTVSNSVLCYNTNGGSISLNVIGGNSNYSTNWYGPNSFTANTLGNMNQIYNLTVGIYTATIIDNKGCIISATTNVSQPSNSISISLNPNIFPTNCNSNTGSATVIATGGIGSYIYNFSNSTGNFTTTSTTFNSLPFGNTIVYANDLNNCLSNSVSVHINSVNAPLITIQTNSINCFGGLGNAVANSANNNGYVYLWQNSFSTSNNSGNLVAGTYSVLITDSISGCKTISNFNIIQSINQFSLDIKDIIKPDCEQSNGSISVLVSGGNVNYLYLWSNGAVQATVYNLPSSSYIVTVKDEFNCMKTLEVNLNCNTSIFIPELVSPNNDGLNDFFEIKGIFNYPNNKLSIFNRWGNIIYEKEKYMNDWNGKSNVNDATGEGFLPSGTYFVIFEFGDQKTKAYKGFVQLNN